MRILYLLLLYSIVSCSENQPQYTLARPTPGERVVLVEEFSGARCPNCPQGTQELDNLKDIYQDQLVVVTIHAGDFAFMYPESVFDFTTEEGDAILDLLGNPIGYPSAVINRKRDDGSSSYQVFSSKWSALISSALAQDPVIEVSLSAVFDPDSRLLEANVAVVPQQDIVGSLSLVVLLKEDNLIDPQADRAEPSGVVFDYHHHNVLRKVLSAVDGDLLYTGPRYLQRLEKNYRFELPAQSDWWKANDMQLVAFVVSSEGEVMQAAEIPLQP